MSEAELKRVLGEAGVHGLEEAIDGLLSGEYG